MFWLAWYGASLCVEHIRIFLCNGEMYSTYAAASVARDVCSCCATSGAVLLCALLRMRLKPLNFSTSLGKRVIVSLELERHYLRQTNVHWRDAASVANAVCSDYGSEDGVRRCSDVKIRLNHLDLSIRRHACCFVCIAPL